MLVFVHSQIFNHNRTASICLFSPFLRVYPVSSWRNLHQDQVDQILIDDSGCVDSLWYIPLGTLRCHKLGPIRAVQIDCLVLENCLFLDRVSDVFRIGGWALR